MNFIPIIVPAIGNLSGIDHNGLVILLWVHITALIVVIGVGIWGYFW